MRAASTRLGLEAWAPPASNRLAQAADSTWRPWYLEGRQDPVAQLVEQRTFNP
jgi:hypothetical protein